MAFCLEAGKIMIIFTFAVVFLSLQRVEGAFWNGNSDYNTRIFTMNDTATPFDTKRLKLFYNRKPDAETFNAIYRNALSMHNSSDLQTMITTDTPTHFTPSFEDEVYRRYFKEISQRQLKNIQEMTHPKRGMESRSPDIYKLFKIDPVNKNLQLNQKLHLKSPLDLYNNESIPDIFRQGNDGQYGYENKLFTIPVKSKSANNDSESSKKESYFVSYLSDIIPAIEQQIKDGVLSFIEQTNAKTTTDQPQTVRSVNENPAKYEPKSKDDIRYALAKILKDVYKQYEDVKRIYSVILKIHNEIMSVRNEISTKFTSFISNEKSYAEKHNILSRLEKDLLLKQQIFMAKQNEFFKVQKDFNEKQKEFQATQQIMAKNDQKILAKQRELSNQQSEIVKKQEFLATYLKHYMNRLKHGHGLENDKIVPVTPSVQTTPSVLQVEEKQGYKVTPLHPITAEKIQQIIKSHIDESDKPTAFLIKINNQNDDDKIDRYDLMKRFTEHADDLELTQKYIDNLLSKYYPINTNIDKIMNSNKEYQLGRIVDLAPDNIIQLLKQPGEVLTADSFRKALAEEELPKRFKKDRKKRSLDIKSERNRSFQKLKNRSQIKIKKREQTYEPEKISAPVEKSVVTVVARGNSEKENAALEKAQRYCNEIDQNSSELSFNHCINKFLSWNQAAVQTPNLNAPKMLTSRGSTPEDLRQSADNPVDHEKDSLSQNYALVEIRTEKSKLEENKTLADRAIGDYMEKIDSEQETPSNVKGNVKIHTMPDDGIPEDTDGVVYWDASVYGNNKYSAAAKEASAENSMEGIDYPFLDADALELLSRRKDYVQQYNSKVLASAKSYEEKARKGRKKKDKA